MRPPSLGEGKQEGAGKRVGVGERAPPVRRGFLAARGGGGVAAAVAAAAKMAEGLERVRISASELRGILATLAPQAGSRGELRRPAAGPGLPAPPPSLPPPRPVGCARSPRPFPQQCALGPATTSRRVWLSAYLGPWGRAQLEFLPPPSCSPRRQCCSRAPVLSSLPLDYSHEET